MQLTPEDYSSIREYIKNPTRSGIWRLSANWERSGGVSSIVWEQLSAKVASNHPIAVQFKGQEIRLQPSSINTDNIKDVIENKITFLFELFKHLQPEDKDDIFAHSTLNYETQLILAAIDTDKIRTEFSKADEFYRQNIHSYGFSTSVRRNRPTIIRDSFFLLAEPPSFDGRLRFLALSSQPLERLKTFLVLTGKISEPSLRKVFSPEEEVFEPYFNLVQASHSAISSDARLSPHFARAFTEYAAERYESSIGALGVIAEDYLTQVYETLLRDAPPRGKTLGQLYDCLHSEVRNLFRKAPPKSADLNELYGKVNEALKASASGSAEMTTIALVLIRDVINAIKLERASTQDAIRQMRDHDAQVTVFPPLIRANLNDLIRYRNAAAHKTRVPLGNYEALRALYSLVSFAMWWQESIEGIDWHASRDDIIAKFVKDAGT
ncbi:hypothetical protein [Sorangium sp. So ce542]|uniref:hypothetical protein n=1 Tax=Sorangium sp. So ce542 TaxID=3133316 RepID=UPI003F647CD4